MDEYICHSGGADGADFAWEIQGKIYGIKTIAYSFPGHNHNGKNPKILYIGDLIEGYSHVKKANEVLKRNIYRMYDYVKNLLSRNWYQVKNSDAVFTIGTFLTEKIVSGGTGWAVQMAIDNKKDVYVFDQDIKSWFKFNYDLDKFDMINYIPKLTKNFAGIGTREINDAGIDAIKAIYKNNFIQDKAE